MTRPARDLEDFLTDDYCAACDSFGHTELKHGSMLWCNVCWDWAKRVPSSLRRAIEAATRMECEHKWRHYEKIGVVCRDCGTAAPPDVREQVLRSEAELKRLGSL